MTIDMTQILSNVLPTAGVGGMIAMLMFYFYRKDSEAWMKRFEALASDHKSIIQDNTKAITQLSERLLER